MINYKKGKCPRCHGFAKELMFSNNPLNNDDGCTLCFDCIKEIIDPTNLSQADFFCRTYNLPFDPNIWIEFVNTYQDDVFREYTSAVFEGGDDNDHANLYYSSSTKDLWNKANSEWEKARTFAEILKRIDLIKDSYIERGQMKWGNQYTFDQLLKLDSIYSKTLRANRITNPIQKAAVQTLCKLQVEMDEAIQEKDSKAIKDFSSSWSVFAKQADLENMINETKTDDVTTVSELYEYAEELGFEPEYYQGETRDDIDMAIKDITESNRRLILESTGLQQTLEEMIEQQRKQAEEAYTQEVTSETTLQDLMDFKPEDIQVEVENDSDIEDLELFADEERTPSRTTVIKLDKKEES